jgi:hypothetical protein
MPQLQLPQFGGTFDLAKAYSDAERIKAVQAETQDRSRRTDLLAQEVQQQQLTAEQEQEAITTYSEMKAFANDEAYKTRLYESVKAKNPELASRATPQQIYDMRLQGLEIALKVTPEKDSVDKMYEYVDPKTGQPAYGGPEDVRGQRPYDKPAAPQQYAPDKPQLVEITLPDGRIQKQWVLPGQTEGKPVGQPYTRATTPVRDPFTGEWSYPPPPPAAGAAPKPADAAPQASGQPAPPKVGEVRKGYRYIGGDPASQSSWKKTGATGSY